MEVTPYLGSSSQRVPATGETSTVGKVFGLLTKTFKWVGDNRENIANSAQLVSDLRDKIFRSNVPTPDPISGGDIQQYHINKRLVHDNELVIRELTDIELSEQKEAKAIDDLANYDLKIARHVSSNGKHLARFVQKLNSLEANLKKRDVALSADEAAFLNGLSRVKDTIKALLLETNMFEHESVIHDTIEGAHNILRDIIDAVPTVGPMINAGIDMGKMAYRASHSRGALHANDLIQQLYVDTAHYLPHSIAYNSMPAITAAESNVYVPEDPYNVELIIGRNIQKELESLNAHHECILKTLLENKFGEGHLPAASSLHAFAPLKSHGECFQLILVDAHLGSSLTILTVDLVSEKAIFRVSELTFINSVTSMAQIEWSRMRSAISPIKGEPVRRIFDRRMSHVGRIAVINDNNRIRSNMIRIASTLQSCLVGTIDDCRRSVLERVLYGVSQF